MKRRLGKRRFLLMRPADALLPLAFLAGDMFGPTTLKGWIFAGWLAVRIFSLFSADSVRMAFATQPGMRKVKGSTTLAALMQIIGAVIAAGLYAVIFHGITPFTLAVIGIGLILNIEQVFCEYLYASGDRYSASICSLLTAVFLLAGHMLERSGIPMITLLLAGGACLISIMVAVISGGFRPCKPNNGVILHIPRALVYGVAYPLVISAAIFAAQSAFSGFFAALDAVEKLWLEACVRAGFFAGLALMALYRTPFRRSSLECREMWPVLGSTFTLCIIAGVVCGLVEGIPGYVFYAVCAFCVCLMLAVIVILALWANFIKEE